MTLSEATAGRLRRQGLDPAAVEELAGRALAEDLDGGVDVTTAATVPAGLAGVGELVARQPGVVAGLGAALAVLEVATGAAADVTAALADGSLVAGGDVVLAVRAPVAALLTAERSALNLLCHLSGVATATRAWADALAGTGARVRDSRKTMPGLRALEKAAVRAGGGVNHRMSLSDQALVKDNHVLAAGGVAAALRAVRAACPGLACEVECDTLEQVDEAVEAGAGLLLLDNFTVKDTAEAVRRVAGRARLEASGGLTLGSARAVAATGVDFLSVGALTHSAPALDIGLDLVPLTGSGERR